MKYVIVLLIFGAAAVGIFQFAQSKQELAPTAYPFILTREDDTASYDRILRQAKPSTVLDIKNCNAEPRIIKVANDTVLTVKNTGPVSHYITINKKDYFVAAGKQITFTVTAIRTPTVYAVACDVPGPRAGGGILVVE